MLAEQQLIGRWNGLSACLHRRRGQDDAPARHHQSAGACEQALHGVAGLSYRRFRRRKTGVRTASATVKRSPQRQGKSKWSAPEARELSGRAVQLVNGNSPPALSEKARMSSRSTSWHGVACMAEGVRRRLRCCWAHHAVAHRVRLGEHVVTRTRTGVLRRGSVRPLLARRRALHNQAHPQRLPRGLHALEPGRVGVLAGAVRVHAQHLQGAAGVSTAQPASAHRRHACTHRPVVRLPNLRRRGVRRDAQDVVRVWAAHAAARAAALLHCGSPARRAHATRG